MYAPYLPYLDWGACPFEGCLYQQWTARAPVVAYDTWKEGRHRVARLELGDKVEGVTGVVITVKPGLIRVDHDMPGLKDQIFTYSYRGAGYTAVWFKGRFYPSFYTSFAKSPDGNGCGGHNCEGTYVDLGKKTWWAQIKLKSGQTAWVLMDDSPFGGVDAPA